MMNLVLFGYFATSNNFAELTDINIKKMLFDQRMREIDDDMVPFGFHDDGLDELPPPTPEEILGQEWSLEYKDIY